MIAAGFRTGRWRPLAGLALTGGAVFLIAVVGIELTRETGRIAALWGANAVLLAALLNDTRNRPFALAASGFFGNVAANLATGDAFAISLALPACNLVEVLICYFALVRIGDRDLTRTRTLTAFCVIAAGPASVASALLAAIVLTLLLDADPVGAFITWYAADALGLITFTPLFASIGARPFKRATLPDSVPRALLTTFVFAAAMAAIFMQSRYPLLFIAFPALVMVAFQFGFFGASLALVATAMVALFATVNHMGPLTLVQAGLREKIAVLQGFLAVSALMSLAVAAVLAERERLTEQRRAATDAARAAERRMRESEMRYRLLAEHTSDVIVLGTLEGAVDYVSPSVSAMLGYAPAEFCAGSLSVFVHEDDLPRVVSLRSALGPERPNATSLHRLRTRSGSYLWVETAYAFVAAADGGAIKILAVVRDVSERRAQAAQLDVAREAAEAGLKAKSEFLAMMSHELRTPLNSIIGFSDLLRDGDELRTALGRRYAKNIEASSKALLSIVNDVMDVSKLEAGAVELDVRPFSFRRLVGDAASIMRGEAEAKGLEFRVEIDGRIPDRLLCDDARLRQVLLNLLSNAVKFTSRGEVAIKAACVAEGVRHVAVRIAVSDTGIGIPQDKLHRLFKRFSQVDQTTSRRFGGTGLGLSISSDLIGLMGGAIDVTSRVGDGTTFGISLELPTAPLADQEPTVAKPERPKEAGLRILVAEDVAMNQELLSALLGRWGHEAEIAGDGAAAVAAAGRRAYDLILMDVQMPSMDGVEATRRIRAGQGPCRSVPIVALTANVLPDEIARFRAAGMDDHVGKPFAPDALRAAIARSRSPRFGADPPAAEAGTPPFDERVLAELAELVGPAAIQSYLRRFEDQLKSTFLFAPQDEGQLAALRYQAHALASTAGMLGFRRLSNACIALETRIDTQRSGVSAVFGAFAEALAARDLSLPILVGLMRPELRAAG